MAAPQSPDPGLLSSLVADMCSDDDAVAEQAARSVAAIVGGGGGPRDAELARSVAGAEGMLAALTAALGRPGGAAALHAATAIQRIAASGGTKMALLIAEAGALPPLVNLMQNQYDSATAGAAAGALRLLCKLHLSNERRSLPETCVQALTSKEGITALAEAIQQDATADEAVYLLSLAAGYADHDETRQLIVGVPGAAEALVGMLISLDPDAANPPRAAHVIRHLTRVPAVARTICDDADLLPMALLASMERGGDAAAQAAEAFVNIAQHSSGRCKLLASFAEYKTALAAVVRAFGSSDKGVAAAAIKALTLLVTASPTMREDLAETRGALKAVVQALAHGRTVMPAMQLLQAMGGGSGAMHFRIAEAVRKALPGVQRPQSDEGGSPSEGGSP